MIVPRADSAENGEDSIEDIKDSLDRIEELLSRGHQLLHGEEDAMAALSPLEPQKQEQPRNCEDVTSAPSPATAPAPRAAAESVGIKSKSRPGGAPARPAPKRLATTVNRVTALPCDGATPGSKKVPRKSQASLAKPKPTRGNLPRRQGNGVTLENSASIDESAVRLRDARAEGRRVPNLEEGVDDDDVAQDISIDELKARIHRELEEYRRNGPLMKRRNSVQRDEKRKARIAVAAPQRVQARKEKGNDEDRATAAAPPARPWAVANKSSVPKKTTTVSRAPTSKNNAPALSAPKSRAVPTTSTSTRHPVRSSVYPTATRASTAPKKLKPAEESPKPAAVPAAPCGRQSIWERLYNDAAAQQEKLERKREQARIEQKSRQTQPATNYNRRIRASAGTKHPSATQVARQQHHKADGAEYRAAALKPTTPSTAALPKATDAAANKSTSGKDFQPFTMDDQTPEDFSLNSSRRDNFVPSTKKHAKGTLLNGTQNSTQVDELEDSTQVPPSVTPLDFRNLKK